MSTESTEEISKDIVHCNIQIVNKQPKRLKEEMEMQLKEEVEELFKN
jgi:hypothetical protein